MIDFIKTYLPPLNSKAEIKKLCQIGAIIEDKDENEFLQTSQFAQYIVNRCPCFCIHEKLYIYNWETGAYEHIDRSMFLHVVYAYLEAVHPEMVHKINDHQVWQKALNFAKARKNFSPNVRYVAFSNITIDILNRKRYKHSPKHYVSNCIPHEHIKGAKCPIFDEALNTIFDGDKDVISAFWEMAGYLLYYGQDYPLQKIFLFFGTGSNGKSLVLDVLRYMLGEENCSSARLDEISTDFGASHFYGSMVNISPETELKKPADTALLKSITGGDSVSTNMKHAQVFSSKHYTKFLISANALFPMNDNSDGMFRRFFIFPFKQKFVEPPLNDADRIEGVLYSDKQLLQKIKPEVSGIINRALSGLFRLQRNQWTMTEAAACQKTLDDIKRAFAPFKYFVKEHIQVVPKKRVLRKDLIDAFYEYQQTVQIGQTYCSYSRELVSKNLIQELQQAYPDDGIACIKSNGIYVFTNIQVI